jgi:hypothetical protein
MIVWINGAFGSGKTTTAALVPAWIPGARIFDPEYVGYLLTTFVPAPTGDFQDMPLWRRLTVQTVKGLDDEYGGTWVAPMSLIRADYRCAPGSTRTRSPTPGSGGRTTRRRRWRRSRV